MAIQSELNQARVLIGIHTLAAIIVGLVSPGFDVWMAGLIGILALVVLGALSAKLASKKVWLGNGLVIYLFVWFVSWVLFYNIL